MNVIEAAKAAGMEVHERKGQIRIGSAILTGADSTDQVERFAQIIRNQALEDAAKCCASLFDLRDSEIARLHAAKCADSIRSMKKDQTNG